MFILVCKDGHDYRPRQIGALLKLGHSLSISSKTLQECSHLLKGHRVIVSGNIKKHTFTTKAAMWVYWKKAEDGRVTWVSKSDGGQPAICEAAKAGRCTSEDGERVTMPIWGCLDVEVEGSH